MAKSAKNLAQKLIEVRKAVPYLKKDKEGYKFKYTGSSQVLGALRSAMDEQGVLLQPVVTDAEIRDHTTKKGDHEYFTALTMVFTWINADDPAETMQCAWYGQGLDSGEKGVGKAVTYAEKYFLLKFFNIPTDKDDPDAFQGDGDTPARKKTREEGGKSFPSKGKGARRPQGFEDYDPTGDTRPITEPQRKRLFAKSRAIKATDGEMTEFLKLVTGVDSSNDLNREQIDKVFKLMETFEAAGDSANIVFKEYLRFQGQGAE